ncbi:MAG: NADP-dependent malic enzyme, partial [Rikenellaceae bacterium]|nr:NADP-dependent malic enzyme [Rikenellaceae bacterium]
ATCINEEMKIAAVKAIAALTKEPVPDFVTTAYGGGKISFGRDYLIPKPLDPRLIVRISTAVAQAAIASGVARHEITDWEAYGFDLERRMGRDNQLLQAIRNKARAEGPRKILFAGAERLNTLKAALQLYHDGLTYPILLGERERLVTMARENNLDLNEKLILDFRSDSEIDRRNRYAEILFGKLNRQGLSLLDARKRMKEKDWFGLMAAYCNDVDSVILSYGRRYTKALEPARAIFKGISYDLVAAMVIVMTKQGPMFFADMAVNTEPTDQELVKITLLANDFIKKLGVEPVIAMLSYSNFGTDTEEQAAKVARAVDMLHERHPEILVDGEIKVDYALDTNARLEKFPFTKLGERDVNTFIFPNLSAANISYKLVEMLGNAEVTGPVLLGINAGVHIISDYANVRSIANLAILATTDKIRAGSQECIVPEKKKKKQTDRQ